MKRSWLTPVERIREGSPEIDRDGDPIAGTGGTATDPLPDALFVPGGSQILVAPGVAAVVDEPTLYWRGTSSIDVVATDKVRVAGRVWTPEGNPARWPKGVVLKLKAQEAKNRG
ncbi:Hypothetical protein PFR_JS17-2_2044 [Propionibacterium freudenreichii]|nr:Hypothetical protein PFR_JS17-1_2045 [Propionibacterium freudenreichii]SCQ81273.1 Hypothetical protein PFR_JS17-2_2044 [Propionibacterium freudenreichii]